MNRLRPWLSAFFILLTINCTSLLAQDEAALYRSARDVEEVAARIAALQKFVADFPSGQFTGSAYNKLFSTYLEINDGPAALDAAEKYLATMPENRRGSAYNGLAWQLAEKKVGLPTAARYAQLAEEWARAANNPRSLKAILDTRAFVLFQMGDAKQAEALQNEAVIGNEDDPEYTGRLALYQEAAGHRTAALQTAAHNLITGGGDETLERFFSWIAQEYPQEAVRTEKREKLVMGEVQKLLQGREDDPLLRSQAAVFMARTAVRLDLAEQWARDGVSAAAEHGGVSEAIAARMALAKVYSAQGQHRAVLATVYPVRELIEPWDSDFWIMMSTTQEALGQKEEALKTLLQAAAVYPQDQLMAKAEQLFAELNGGSEGFSAALETARKEISDFSPGRYSGSTSGNRVVLAELFTGAECAPCAGADRAFDALSEYYNRQALAILEYHLHIPGPDPLTNHHSEARYGFYGRNFGTPTVFINGTEKITGGGPAIVARNRFTSYNYIIQKGLEERTAVKISATADLSADQITLDGQVEGVPESAGILNVALAEKAIHYEGGNGVNHHIFVVRALMNGGEGLPIKGNSSDPQRFHYQFDLKAVETGLSQYLEQWQQENASRFRGSDGWRERPEKLDRSNLSLVLWVQDPQSKEVWQSLYREVPSASASR